MWGLWPHSTKNTEWWNPNSGQTLTFLFKLRFTKQKLQEQWLIWKTIPIHKKAPSKTLEIIAPLQTTPLHKDFQKAILKRIEKLEALKKQISLEKINMVWKKHIHLWYSYSIINYKGPWQPRVCVFDKH